jgi:hypothetical protein
MHIRPHCVISGVIFVLLSPQLSRSQNRTQTELAALTKSLAGCYDVKISRWRPWGFGEEDVYVMPPNRIELLAERGTRGFEERELLIRTIPRREEPPGSRESSFWIAKSQKRVMLVWTDGFVGVSLDLAKHGDELSRWAHPHFDALRLIPRIAHVTARRIACPS